MGYDTLLWNVDEDGIATLTLNRPDALNAFNVTMARELEQVFLNDALDDSVRAVVVTGAGRAFCAGMDLSAEGNVFGLNESLRPTPSELRGHLTDQPYQDGVRDTGGRVTLAIHALPPNRRLRGSHKWVVIVVSATTTALGVFGALQGVGLY